MASFERALELGADWIELDVHLSRDEALIVIHDETLDRTTNGHGLVREHTLAELRMLDAGGGQCIPTLDEVLAWARERGTIVDIEIKNAPIYYEGIEQRVVSTLDRLAMTEQVIVISFDHAAVKRVKELEARIATGVLYACRPTDAGVGLARAAGADAVLPHWAYVTPADVTTAHAAGLSVAPWATSDPEILRELIACGVDAIGTNHPDILRDVLASDKTARNVVTGPAHADSSQQITSNMANVNATNAGVNADPGRTPRRDASNSASVSASNVGAQP